MDFTTNLAARAYLNPATASRREEPAANPAADAIGDFAEMLAETESIAKEAMTGSVDPHALVEALSQTEMAVETAVAVRDKVVEAYQEILRMPV